MASYLGKYTKNILLQLANEFTTSVSTNDKKVAIIQAILSAPDYEESLMKSIVEGILENQAKEEERQDKLRREEQERQEREQERLRRFELEEKENLHKFELEKLKIQNSVETGSTVSTVTVGENKEKRVNLKDLVPKFDPKIIDISLFFIMFERQAKKEELEESRWVSQLIPLLPVDVAEVIVKEPVGVADDYKHMKNLLMRRFRLSAGALKAKFENHQRKPNAAWSDLVYELRSYLDNWLDTVKVQDFESLKELILTEQLKRRVPFEIKDKFLDEWDAMKVATELAEKCDKYESVRGGFRKMEQKIWNNKPFNKDKNGQGCSKGKGDQSSKTEGSDKRGYDRKNSWNKERFDKRKPITCYNCNRAGHIRPDCPDLRNRNSNVVSHLNEGNNLGECFKPYFKKALINGVERDYLRDTGAGIDLCDSSWVNSDDFTGEITWIKQPLDSECKCLPLARITITGDFGTVVTKAAVKPSEMEQGYYLLGNKTAELIEEVKINPVPINAVITRSKKRCEEGNVANQTVSKFESEKEIKDVSELKNNEEEKVVDFPDKTEIVAGLEKVSAVQFLEKQKNCSSLKPLWERAKQPQEKEFAIREGKLVRLSQSKRGEEKLQLCVPELYRSKILVLCHEQMSGHLGATKTKDRVLRCYFWPNCYQEIENYVRTCDSCQKVGSNRDKRKAPLKLVPIISEVFSKINLDAVGPLPFSNKNNRYLITSICLASKYPDAIPVENITSTSVIDALVKIFSRTGFPREVQCDLGRSFTSELTTEFFNKFGIKVSHSSVCHPESNSVERLHSTLKRVIKALCLESGRDWEEVLPMALFALRTVTHESTGFSPSELVHGKNLRMPHTLVYENWLGQESTDQNVVDYILNLTERLKRCQDLAVKRMAECQEKRKTWYDRNAVSRKFKVGDQVLVLSTSKANKMEVNWIGPGTVTSVISDTNYTIDLPEKRNKATIYHVNLIKPYHKRPEFVNLMIEIDSEEVEEDAEIPYPLFNPTQIDFLEIVNSNNLEKRATESQLNNFREVIEKHGKVFSSDPGRTHLVEMDIELTDEIPIRSKPYRMSPRQTEIMREEIRRLLDLNVIEVGQSDFTSPMILVETPGKDPRPCVDYRKLNAKTRVEYFPLPNIEEVVEKVSSATFITVMDLTKGYFQIPLTKRARRYAAIVTPFGVFLPKVMMFGLLNAPFYFCKLIARVLGGLESYALPYIDDIAVFSLSWETHMKHLAEVLKCLEAAGLTVKPSKCKFAQDSVKFLGHEVGSGKRSPSEVKVKAIQDFPVPKTKTQVRSFLGMTGYYSRYIKDYAVIAVPLTNILKGKVKKEKIEWNEECDRAFNDLKSKLIQSPVLYSPDFTKEFIVQTDASLYGAGIVLSQIHSGEEHPILFLSKKFSKAEQNYSTIERELAAIVYALKKLNHYLDGQRFVVQTDHNPLTFLQKMAGTNSRLTRWALSLMQYNFTVVHRPGKLHGNADGLSRAE